MFSANVYNFVNVLDKAADASWARNEILSNNIANVDTPDFKRSDINFESYLSAELEGAGASSIRETVANVELNNINYSAYTDMSELSYRLDGNNVDIDTENVELASNQVKYNALLDSISNEFNMIKIALTK